MSGEVVPQEGPKSPAPLSPPPADNPEQRLLPWVRAHPATPSEWPPVSTCFIRQTGLYPFYQAKAGTNVPAPPGNYTALLSDMPGHHEPVPKDKYLKRLVFGMEGEAPTILPFNPDTLSRACSGMQCGTIPGFDASLLGLGPPVSRPEAPNTTPSRPLDHTSHHPSSHGSSGEKKHKKKKKRTPEEIEERRRRKLRKKQAEAAAALNKGGLPPLNPSG
ncbi:MAG: hypothetical protein DHS80DRAFT_33360 [Piptocephalis tieghemiana]|nr:MAG: hypothetical protein DHS80DRAFT_33360 [Piptocephalis tieghemiana]